MKSLKKILQEKLANSEFKAAFDKESKLASLAIEIAKRREKKGLTQRQLARRAEISQQQVSRVEKAGVSGMNLKTLVKVCDALDLDISLKPREGKGSTKKTIHA